MSEYDRTHPKEGCCFGSPEAICPSFPTDQPPRWTSRRATRIAAGVIVLATALAYCNSFYGVFIFDDRGAIPENESIRHLWPIWDTLSPPANGSPVQRRPLVNLSLAINYAISGLNVWSYHALNLIAHTLAALLLFGVVRRTLLLPSQRDRWRQTATPLALSIALLWAVHPLLTDAVTYVIQRTEILAGLFYLLTLYCVIRGVASTQPTRWFIAAVVACALAICSKEAAISAPVVVMLYDRVFLSGSWREVFRRRWGLYAGLAATWTIVLLMLPHGHEGAAVFGPAAYRVLQYAAVQCGVITHYLRLCFWPQPLVVDYGLFTTITAGQIIPYVLLMTGLAAGIVVALRYQPWLGFLGVWFFAILAPSSSIIPLHQQFAAEKRMYLPLAAVITAVVIGAFYMVRWLVGRGYLSRRNAMIASTEIVAFATIALGIMTYERNADYYDAVLIWQDTVAKAPRNSRAWTNCGKALMDIGQETDAVQCFERALQLNPDDPDAHNNIGLTLARKGQPDAAIEHYEKALKVNPNLAETHNNLGNVLRGQDRFDEAYAQFHIAVQLKPSLVEAQKNLGTMLAKRGQLDDAIAHYRTALEFGPDHEDVHFNLANALVRKQQSDEAIKEYKTAIELRPSYADAHNNLGLILAAREQYADAVAHFEKALRFNPDHADAHNNLGSLLVGQGRTDDAIAHFERALELKPENDEARTNLSTALAQRTETHPSPAE